MCHVLIIEDEPLIAMTLRAIVEDNGATSVDVADTQAEAVEAALRRPPVIITSDVCLRAGKGPEAVEVIREKLGEVPVIFVTATPEGCPPAGRATRVFAKPIDEAAVARTFRELMVA